MFKTNKKIIQVNKTRWGRKQWLGFRVDLNWKRLQFFPGRASDRKYWIVIMMLSGDLQRGPVLQGKICQTCFLPPLSLWFSHLLRNTGSWGDRKTNSISSYLVELPGTPTIFFFLLLRISFLHPAVFPDEALSLEKMLLSEAEDLGMSCRRSQLGRWTTWFWHWFRSGGWGSSSDLLKPCWGCIKTWVFCIHLTSMAQAVPWVICFLQICVTWM